jgi:predicted GIY-YIG superfamily endonuclease
MVFIKPYLKWSEMRINDTLNTSIYALKDEDGTILYIGKTKHTKQRFSAHMGAKNKSCGSSSIPDDIRSRMTMEILEKCSDENGSDREAFWFNKLNPEYNKMRLVKYDEEHNKLQKKKDRQRYLDKYYGGKEPPPKIKVEKPEPKTACECECGVKFNVEIKEWNLKQHRETSSQHKAWLTQSSMSNNQDVPV